MKDKKLYPYERQMNFIRLMDEAFDENIEEIKKELQDEGIDVNEVQKELLGFIKKQKAKLSIEKGKLMKQAFIEKLKSNSAEPSIESVMLAFRGDKNSKSQKEVDKDMLDKLNVIKEIKKQFDGDSDDESNKIG
jgi:ATP-dependent Clp protease ATP-binding subunit ClpA